MHHPLITLAILGMLIIPGHSQQSRSTSGVEVDPKLLLAQPQTTKDRWNLTAEGQIAQLEGKRLIDSAGSATRFPGLVPTMEMVLDILEAQKKIATILETQVGINQDLLIRVKKLESGSIQAFHSPAQSTWIMSGEPAGGFVSDPSDYVSVVIPGGQIRRWNLAEANGVLVALAKEINRISKSKAKTTGVAELWR